MLEMVKMKVNTKYIFPFFFSSLKDNCPFKGKQDYCVNSIGKNVKLKTTTQRIRDWDYTVVRYLYYK